MNAPRYAVYMMLDEPHANASTHGYATAGWVAAPSAGRVIARAGPMLGILPDLDDKTTIQQALYIPLRPSRPAGAGRAVTAAPAKSTEPVPAGAPGVPARPVRDLGRAADGAVTPAAPTHAVSTVAAR